MFFRPTKGKHVACQKFRHHDFALPANMGQKWCQKNLPTDSVRRLTLPGEFVGRPWDKGWGDWQLTDCFHHLMRAVKAFADLVRKRHFGMMCAFLMLSEQ